MNLETFEAIIEDDHIADDVIMNSFHSTVKTENDARTDGAATAFKLLQKYRPDLAVNEYLDTLRAREVAENLHHGN